MKPRRVVHRGVVAASGVFVAHAGGREVTALFDWLGEDTIVHRVATGYVVLFGAPRRYDQGGVQGSLLVREGALWAFQCKRVHVKMFAYFFYCFYIVQPVYIYPSDSGLVFKRKTFLNFFCFFFLELRLIIIYNRNPYFISFCIADVD